MLPRTPRLGTRGLPSNPRPRSRSVVRDDVPDRHSRDGYHNDSRSSSLSRSAKRIERSRTPPLSRSPRPLHEDKSHLTARSTHKSDDSASSITSSLFERIKLGGDYAPRTSLEEEDQNSYPTSRPSRKPKAERNFLPSQETTGTGEVVWNRLATVASHLTVSVSKAWTTNITTFMGEETPPGQESRLTRTIKAYHLEKARDPNDLPSWLFDERERPRLASYSARRDSEHSHQRSQSVAEIPKSRGLRDIYDAYRPETPVPNPFQRLNKDNLAPPSGATDRLKTLRDAKRTAVSTRRPPQANQPKTSEYDVTPKPAVTQRPRVGLPSGPRRRERTTDVAINDVFEDDR